LSYTSTTKTFLDHIPTERNVRQHVPGKRQDLKNQANDNSGNPTTAAKAVAFDRGKNDGQYQKKEVPEIHINERLRVN
jgi:hypothetical protein